MYTYLKIATLTCISIFMLNACKQEQHAIEFVKITDVDLGNLKKENATLNGIAVFRNNSKTATFIMDDMVLNFSVDGKDIGTIVIKNKRKIDANTEFSVPFSYKYVSGKILDTGNEPAAIYAVQLLGKLNVTDGAKEESSDVKYAESYEYKTAKEERIEKREEKREARKERREQRKEERKNK